MVSESITLYLESLSTARHWMQLGCNNSLNSFHHSLNSRLHTYFHWDGWARVKGCQSACRMGKRMSHRDLFYRQDLHHHSSLRLLCHAIKSNKINLVIKGDEVAQLVRAPFWGTQVLKVLGTNPAAVCWLLDLCATGVLWPYWKLRANWRSNRQFSKLF